MKNHNYTQKEITFCNNVRWGLLTYTALVILVVLLSAYFSHSKAQKQSDLYQYPTHRLKVALNDRKAVSRPFLGIKTKPTVLGVAAIVFAAGAGVARGAGEAYHADPYVFENLGWDGLFWRHNAWENNYYGNKYRNEDGSINQHKPETLGNFGREVWHTAGDVATVGYGLAVSIIGLQEGIRIGQSHYQIGDKYLGIRLGKRSRHWLPPLTKMAALSFTRTFWEKATYNKLRYGKVF